jgi:tape measure domain-containing protein
MDLATTYTIKAKVTGQDSINGLNKGLNKTEKQSNKTAAAFNKLKNAGSSLMGVLGSIGATAAVTGFVKAGIDMQRTQKTLKILTEEYNEHEQVLKFVDEAANRFGIGQQKASRGVADLFGRLRPMGISLDQIKDTYLGLNNAALKMNLSTADTEGAMLQLSQALGSGVLQGDEFRSIMERLPAIGQAVADVMGVNVSELKQLSSDGVLTTDVIIKAMRKLREMDVPPPDSFKLYNKAMENFSTLIGTKLLPAFTPFVNFLTSILEKFANLPAPLQTIIAGVTALAAGIVIIAPALGLIVTGLGALGTAIGAAVGFFAPLLAGGAIPLAIIGIGVLIYKFRDQIGAVFKAIGQILMWPFVQLPIKVAEVLTNVVGRIKEAFNAIPNFVKSAINAATAPIRTFISFIKRALALLNKFRRRRKNNKNNENNGTPPGLAAGGVVSSPQLIYAGEAGSEYVVPARKAAQFSKNYLSGMRGSAAIPRFAEGGYITRPNVNITTGAVTQMDGTNFITTNDLSSAVQSGIDQTLNLLQSDLLTRRSLGLT